MIDIQESYTWDIPDGENCKTSLKEEVETQMLQVVPNLLTHINTTLASTCTADNMLYVPPASVSSVTKTDHFTVSLNYWSLMISLVICDFLTCKVC